MPNTLAHFGVNGLARFISPAIDLKWIYIGCLIPDIPWIIQRIFPFLSNQPDYYQLRAYCIIQASFLFCMVFSGAVALLFKRTWSVFIVLASGSLLHLLLDAMQTKWANGVHFLAPYDWTLVNFGLFWPENYLTYALTLWGIVYFLWYWQTAVTSKVEFKHLDLSRSMLLSMLILLYLAGPLLFINQPVAHDNHYLETLQNSAERYGKPVAFDRVRYAYQQGSPAKIKIFSGEQLQISPLPNVRDEATVSIKGIFRDETRVEVLQYHEHRDFDRDWASLAGIILLILLFSHFLLAQFKLVKFKKN